jgi:hypothetical protein
MSTEPGNGRRRINDITRYQQAVQNNATYPPPVDVMKCAILDLFDSADVMLKIVNEHDDRTPLRAQLADELGHILFCTARLATVLGADLGEIAADNLRKM